MVEMMRFGRLTVTGYLNYFFKLLYFSENFYKGTVESQEQSIFFGDFSESYYRPRC